jgi:23S rRNA (adenine2030-N6)-methyltransferase
VNYRHHYHAGNFADVMKHVLLLQLAQALQKKEKGFLYLDTHAGRGAYDLTLAATGDSLARTPEWPDGIGRLWAGENVPAGVAEYLARVREFDWQQGNREGLATSMRGEGTPPTGAGEKKWAVRPRYYPGSPMLVENVARPQDRVLLCERQPAEAAALKENFQFKPGVSIQVMDGYGALRAMLPPPEKRALVLIDPPFEAQDEWAQVVTALREGLRRLPSGVYAIWYPLTERAKVDFFFAELQALELPPTLAVELVINPAAAKMKGCGLAIVNPPWKFAEAAEATVKFLAEALTQGAGARGDVIWLVAEK